MLTLREDVRRNDAPRVRDGQFDQLCFARRLFVKHGLKRRLLDNFDKETVFRSVEFCFDVLLGEMPEVGARRES